MERFEGLQRSLVLALALVQVFSNGVGSLHVHVGFRRALGDLLLLLLLRNLLQERQMLQKLLKLGLLILVHAWLADDLDRVRLSNGILSDV